ncbi:MAG TPA: hydrogenase maturation protease [Solirubrobacteraceae bacterium]|jgi:hydrogenase maturation protease|nr:hydrogenase maturation protease [Solirubrobacteraceae bacterium]
MGSGWESLERPGPDSVEVGGARVRAGSRVRLWPRGTGDVFDLALTGRDAVVEGIEQDMEGRVAVAVVVDDDPGRDLGFDRQIGHRFFFSPGELEPLEPADEPGPAPSRILLAGIGNVFLGDDGFGVALAERLAARALPAGVDVVDFGIRGMDLAYAMQDGYETVVMLDATPRGQAPGTLYVIEAESDVGEVALDTHGMDPVKVLGLVRALGGAPPRTFVVGCEPQTRMDAEEGELLGELSEPVRAALDHAVKLVESLLGELMTTYEKEVSGP